MQVKLKQQNLKILNESQKKVFNYPIQKKF